MTLYQMYQIAEAHRSLCVIVLIISLSLVEVSKIKLNPWSFIAKWIRKILLGDIKAQLDRIDQKVDKMQDRIDEGEAKASRSRILRFGDELLVNAKHSKDMFDAVLMDIDRYEAYCAAHPDFANNVTVITTKRIKDVYAECLQNHTFL